MAETLRQSNATNAPKPKQLHCSGFYLNEG